MVLVGKPIKFQLKLVKILHPAGLPHVQQPILLFSMNADRLRGPAPLLQPVGGGLRVIAMREKEIMIERLSLGERFVKFLIRLRALWMQAQQCSNSLKHTALF